MQVERYMHIFPNDSAYRYHREYEYNEPFVSFTTETDEPTDVNFNKRNGEANNKHLVVWLPLTGILDNWGNSDITVTNNGATSNTSGKTGDCYYFDGNAHYLQFSDSLTNLYCGDFTWALWLKPTDDTRSILISEYSSAGASNVALELYTNRKVRIYWNGNPDYYPNYNIPKDTWTHLCVTKTNNLLKTYINGVLLEEKSVTLPDRTSTSKIRIGDDYRGGNSVSYMGYLNDVRIYDCCLSAKEVKELSKGLILHYKLNDKYMGTITNMVPIGNYSTSTGSTWGRMYTVSTVVDADYMVPFDTCNKVEMTMLDSGSGGGCGLTRASNIPVTGGAVYTYSMYVKPSDNFVYTHANFLFRREYNSGNTQVLEIGINTPSNREYVGKGWYRIWGVFTANSATTKVTLQFFSYPAKTITYYIGGTQLETGNTLNPFVKETYSNNNIYDSSGYRNTGTIGGKLIPSTMSPKYSTSVLFSNNAYIIAGKGAKVRDAISVCCWAYMDNWGSYAGRLLSCTEGGGWNFEPGSGKMNFAMGTGAASNTYKSVLSTKTLASLGSGWHHFVGTYDGLYTKIYIDGALDGTTTAYSTKTPIFYYASNGIFVGAEATTSPITPGGSYFNGKLSDVRIYATALSDEDIANLYNG